MDVVGVEVGQAWMHSALCRTEEHAPHAQRWFPQSGDSTTAAWAKRVCADCPVQLQCLDHAIEAQELFGIWGGTSARQRKAMMRETRVA